MQLFKPDQVPSMIQGRVCRQSRFVSVVGSLAMLAFMAALPTYLIWAFRPSLWVSFPVLSFASLMSMWIGGVAVKSLRETNWLMRIAPDGLWINLRSFQNREFAAATTVLFVSFPEIAGVSEQSVKRSECIGNDQTIWTDRYLDIRLVEPVAKEVTTELAEERRRKISASHLGGLVTTTSRTNHVPITVPTENVLRLAWRGRFDFVVPSLNKTLRALSGECRVESPSFQDLTDVSSLPSDELDRLILERVESGNTFGAVELLREHHGFSLTDAKKFIDELTVRL